MMDSFFRRVAPQVVPSWGASVSCSWSENEVARPRCDSEESIQSASLCVAMYPGLLPIGQGFALSNDDNNGDLPECEILSSRSLLPSLLSGIYTVESRFTGRQPNGETSAGGGGAHSLPPVVRKHEDKDEGSSSECSSNPFEGLNPLYSNTLPSDLHPPQEGKMRRLSLERTSGNLVPQENLPVFGMQSMRQMAPCKTSDRPNANVVFPKTLDSSFDLSFFFSPVVNDSLLPHAQSHRRAGGCGRQHSVAPVGAHGRHDDGEGNEEDLSMMQKSLDDPSFSDEARLEGMSHLFSEGRNVALTLVYSERAFDALGGKGNHYDRMWSPMDAFFSSVYTRLHSTSHGSATFFMQVSLVVLKHDQMKDLLPKCRNDRTQPAFYTKADIGSSPLYGPYLLNTHYHEVPTLANMRELISASLGGATSDDCRSGVFLISVILRHLSKGGDDISVSSMFAAIATAETFHMVIKKRHPPSTASYFRAVLRNPRLSMSLVIPSTHRGVNISAEEMLLLEEVRQVVRVRSQNLLNATDATSLRSLINLSMDRCVSMIIHGRGGFKGRKHVAAEESFRCKMLHQDLNRLKGYSKNIKLALQAPIGDLLQLLKDEETVKHVSEADLDETPFWRLRKRKHRGKGLACTENRVGGVMEGALRWIPKRIMVNLFAGALAAPVGGIMPLFAEAISGEEETLHNETNPFDDRVHSLVVMETSGERGACIPDIVCVTDAGCVTVEMVGSSPLRFYPDEVCVRRRKIGAGDFITDESSGSVLLRHAISLFVKGFNTAILLMREGTGDESDMFESPVWMAVRKLVESQLESLSPCQKLYLSVTQVLSKDCVRDLVAPSVDASRDDVLLPFRAAWTPAGPVVRGAQFACLRSIRHFGDVLSGLRKNAVMFPTSQFRGVNIILSLLLKRTLMSETAESVSDVLLSSMTFTMVASPEAYKSLWIDECVPLDHSKNLYRCVQRCFTLGVTEVAATSLSAVPFLDTQEILRQTRMPHVRQVCSMRQLQRYLAKRSALYMRETLSREGTNCVPLSREQRRVILSDATVATSHDIAKVWAMVERMRSGVADLLDTTLSSHPMAVVDEDMYDITAPPLCFRHKLNTTGVPMFSRNITERY